MKMKPTLIGIVIAITLVLAPVIMTGGCTTTEPTEPKPSGEETGAIEGTVIDVDGKPVAGMRVSIVSGTVGFPEILALTDERGRYTIGSVPAGTFEVAAHDEEGSRVGLESIVVHGGETSTLNFTVSIGKITDDKGKAAIYAAVVRQLYTVGHNFSEPPNFPIIYLVGATDDNVGDPDAPKTESNLLLRSEQEAIIDALEDLPAEFVWVGNFNEVPLDSNTGVAEGNGAIITLGNVHFQEDESALVSASIHIAKKAAGGLTYIVERIDGVWQVVGDTGVRWTT